MTFSQQDQINYRIEKSNVTFQEAESLARSGFWNSAAARLYYSCFYSVIALLQSESIEIRTHNGVRTEFFKRFIKTNIFSRDHSVLYSDLMNKRQESDYDDFLNFTEEDIQPLFVKAKAFNDSIRKHLKLD